MKLRYNNFAHRINMDDFYEAIEFEPIDSDSNGNDRGYCILPWDLHKNGDTTGKFSIHREKRVWNCWVCSGGNLLDLTMAIKEMSADEATQWLYQFTDDSEDSMVADILRPLDQQEESQPKEMPFYNEHIIDQWEINLDEDDAPGILNQFVIDRNILWPTIQEMKVGFNPEESMMNPKDYSELYVGPAFVIPHYWGGKLVGWQSRWLATDKPDWVKKYKNPPDFPRNNTLYGYHKAFGFGEPPILVESPVTALMLMSQGYSAIASFGASITDEQIKLLRVFNDGVLIAPDNDKPGEQFYDKIKAQLNKYVPLILILPPGGNGDDLGDIKDMDKLHQHIKEYSHGF